MGRRWRIDDLKDAVRKSRNVTEVIERIGLRTAGGNYGTVSKYIEQYDIDISHFVDVNIETLKKNARDRRIPLKELLVSGSNYKSTRLKKRLIDAGLLRDECYICGIKHEWMNKPITLQLDHINGIHTDCRLDNLRILCPNCHSQTENFAGKSSKRKKNSEKNKFKKCPACKDKLIYNGSKLCISCNNMLKRKVTRPTMTELVELLNSHTWVSIGKKFGVSDNAVRKWAKRYGLL